MTRSEFIQKFNQNFLEPEFSEIF